MNSLQPLRKRLNSVGRLRLLLGWAAAFLRFSIEVWAVLLVLFAADFALRLEPAPRVVLMAAAGACLLWRIVVLTRPARHWPEGAVDIALLLGKRQRFASDVVAGLQFEQAPAPPCGSEALSAKVQQSAAESESRLDLRSLIPTAEVRRQALRAAVALAGIVAAALLFSRHSQAFAARLLLNEAAYPTRTEIVEIVINGQPILASRPEARVVEGTPLSIAVRARGVLPDSGTVRVESVASQDATVLTISSESTRQSPDTATYRVQGPQLKESVTLAVELGDARSHAIRVELVQRPIVELRIQAKPPVYTAPILAAETTQDRYVSFLAGSAVSFALRCSNGKQLRRADVIWSSDSATGRASFAPPKPAGDVWQWTPVAAPWQPLAAAVRFAVSVEDEDGLAMLQPLEGRIEVRPDQPPLGSLRTEHHLVVATATPVVRYEASDDFGLAELLLEVSRERSSDVTVMKTIELPIGEGEPAARVARLAGEAAVPLSELDLRNGDRLLVKLLAMDYRGESPGSPFTSEPVEIEIADAARVLRAILEADAAADRLLTDAIEDESLLKETR